MKQCSLCQTKAASGKFLFEAKLINVCNTCSKEIVKQFLIELINDENPQELEQIKEQCHCTKCSEKKHEKPFVVTETPVNVVLPKEFSKKERMAGRKECEHPIIFRKPRSNTGIIGVSYSKTANLFVVDFRTKKSFTTGKTVKLRTTFENINKAVKQRLVWELEHQGRENASQKHLFDKYGIQ